MNREGPPLSEGGGVDLELFQGSLYPSGSGRFGEWSVRCRPRRCSATRSPSSYRPGKGCSVSWRTCEGLGSTALCSSPVPISMNRISHKNVRLSIAIVQICAYQGGGRGDTFIRIAQAPCHPLSPLRGHLAARRRDVLDGMRCHGQHRFGRRRARVTRLEPELADAGFRHGRPCDACPGARHAMRALAFFLALCLSGCAAPDRLRPTGGRPSRSYSGSTGALIAAPKPTASAKGCSRSRRGLSTFRRTGSPTRMASLLCCGSDGIAVMSCRRARGRGRDVRKSG